MYEPKRRYGRADVTPVLRQALGRRRFVVVSNREPYEHYWDEAREEVSYRRPAGGLTSALDPLLQAVGGTWIAWGSGDRDAEVVDRDQCIRVPPDDPKYLLRRLWLDEQDIHHYYHGYANQTLWPLCHLRPALTRVRGRYWERYRQVNERFAEAVLHEVDSSPAGAAVWFQDYHLATCPGVVRERRPDLTLAHFWHIPFPPIEIFRAATRAPALLSGLLANDILGFHLPLYGDNFLRCVESLLHLEVDWDQRAVRQAGHTCYVRSLPISIDPAPFAEAAADERAAARVARLRQRYASPGMQLGIGVDRIDYSKGLEEKLKALDILWQTYPEWRERFTYVQIGVPSRTGIAEYDWLNEKLERMVWSINDRHGTPHWRPIHLLKESLPAERLALYYQAADVAIVGSLQDGMNLVAKEYIAAQPAESAGVLVLSQFAGAAEELQGCISVNPFDPEGFADRIREALLLEHAERQRRAQLLRGSMRTIYDWMVEVFELWGDAARGGAVPLSWADQWNTRS